MQYTIQEDKKGEGIKLLNTYGSRYVADYYLNEPTNTIRVPPIFNKQGFIRKFADGRIIVANAPAYVALYTPAAKPKHTALERAFAKLTRTTPGSSEFKHLVREYS